MIPKDLIPKDLIPKNLTPRGQEPRKVLALRVMATPINWLAVAVCESERQPQRSCYQEFEPTLRSLRLRHPT
jgi:hypothetical protein